MKFISAIENSRNDVPTALIGTLSIFYEETVSKLQKYLFQNY